MGTSPESKKLWFGAYSAYRAAASYACLCAPQPRAAGKRQGNGTLESESAGEGVTEIHDSPAPPFGLCRPEFKLFPIKNRKKIRILQRLETFLLNLEMVFLSP